MEMHWFKPTLQCPHCHSKVSIIDFLYSSDSEVRLDLLCIPCGKELQWVSNFASLVRDSFARDIKLAQTEQTIQQVLCLPVNIPPLTLGAPPKPLTEEDRIELHGLGVKDDDKEDAA